MEVCIPELVAEERRTQWRDKRAEPLRKGRGALEAIQADPMLTAGHRGPLQTALDAVRAVDVDIERVSQDAYDSWIANHRIHKVPLSFNQAKWAWGSYFSGTPPHRKVKSREDIPDAHIFASARELL